MEAYNLKKLKKKIKKHNHQLPSQDPHKVLNDFHTTNARGFYGDSIVQRALAQGDKTFKLQDIVTKEDIIPKEDHNLSFNSGLIAVRNYFRKKSKSSSLAMQYGGTAQVLQNNFKVAKHTSIKMYINFFKLLTTLKTHLEDRVKQAKIDKYVTNLFGRRLYLPQLDSKRFYAQSIKKVYNSPIQGTASDLIKIALLRFSNYIEKHQLSKYQGNNIAKLHKGELYNRIVTLTSKDLNTLNQDLNKLKNGHTKILVVKNNKVIKEYHRNVQLDYYTFKKHNMEIYH